MGRDGTDSETVESRTFEAAKSILYGTISRAGAELKSASRRRETTVKSVEAYLNRIQLDVSGLSVIHVTGTKGKGSTCAMVESVLRRHGFKTGLFTSPHLLEVTERVRCNGKPLSKEEFARYFFQVWDRLQATASTTDAYETMNAAKMPTYFHLLTLVGLWCFVQEGVDVCVLEVGMGGRFDATNVVPPPVACGVAVLDMDHTQVLGDTLDKIAWEKGGIFKKGCWAMTVEQPLGGMSVLRECAEKAGCGELEVVKPLPACDPSGRAYVIGLAGEHQRINAGLALRLCFVWLQARHEIQQQQQQQQHPVLLLREIGDSEAFLSSENVHRGLSDCVWPGRCQVFRPSALPSVTVYLDGAHTEQSIIACLEWFIRKTAKAAVATPAGDPSSPSPQLGQQRCTSRTRRVLWFNSSHERDVVPLLDPLASARQQVPRRSTGESGSTTFVHDDIDEPFFDEAWFMEVKPGRPSQFTPPTVQEILSQIGICPATTSTVAHHGEEEDEGSSCDESTRGREEEKENGGAEAKAGDWQRTLQQVWISLQRRRGGKLSATLTGTAPDLVRKIASLGDTTILNEAGVQPGTIVERPKHLSEESSAIGVTYQGEKGHGEGRATGMDAGGCGAEVEFEVLCTGSLYAVSEALEAFGAEVV